MLHFNLRGTGARGLFDGQLINIVGRAVVKACGAIDSGKLADGCETVCKGGGFYEDAWFWNAGVVAICVE